MVDKTQALRANNLKGNKESIQTNCITLEATDNASRVTVAAADLHLIMIEINLL